MNKWLRIILILAYLSALVAVPNYFEGLQGTKFIGLPSLLVVWSVLSLIGSFIILQHSRMMMREVSDDA